MTIIIHSGGNPTGSPVLSADGGYVAFTIVSTGRRFLFLYARAAGTVTTVADSVSGTPALSADGAYVAFTSAATDLVTGTDTNGTFDVFLYETATGAETLVSHVPGAPGTTGNRGSGSPAHQRGRGPRGVRERRHGPGAPGTDTNGTSDVFLYERATGTISLLSHASGSPDITGNGASSSPVISQSGGVVVFLSGASDLVPSDFNQTQDVLAVAVNLPPSFDPIADLSVNEDSATRTLSITGVTAGFGEDASQSVTLTAVSGSPSIVPNPSISGTGPTRSLSLRPAADASGSARITVAATDSLGATFSRSFTVTVVPQPDADLGVTITESADPVGRGRPLQYTIVVTNNGPDPAQGVVVTTSTPAGTTFQSIAVSDLSASFTAPPAGKTGPVTVKATTLKAKTVLTILLTVNVSTAAGKQLMLTASVASGTPQPHGTTANDVATVTTTVVDVGTVALIPPEPSTPAGGVASFSIEWTIPGGASWRDLKQVFIRLRQGSSTVLTLHFDESQRRCVTGAGLRVLSCIPRASGPGASSVQLALEIQVPTSAAGTRYVIEIMATDDLGNVQTWQPVGVLTVL